MAFNDAITQRVLRLWLSGISRNTIAKRLGFSNGKTSAIIKSLEEKDFAIPLMRELALFCKRNNVDMSELLFKIPFIQTCKRLGVDPLKIASLLAVLYEELELKGLTHEQVNNTIVGLSKLAYGKNIPLHQVERGIREKYENLDQLKSEIPDEIVEKYRSIENTKLMLRANEATMEDLRQFIALRNIFQKYYLDGQNVD